MALAKRFGAFAPLISKMEPAVRPPATDQEISLQDVLELISRKELVKAYRRMDE